MTTQNEKIAYFYCNELLLKNLKTHFSRSHPTWKFKSISNRNILDLFKKKNKKLIPQYLPKIVINPLIFLFLSLSSCSNYANLKKASISENAILVAFGHHFKNCGLYSFCFGYFITFSTNFWKVTFQAPNLNASTPYLSKNHWPVWRETD